VLGATGPRGRPRWGAFGLAPPSETSTAATPSERRWAASPRNRPCRLRSCGACPLRTIQAPIRASRCHWSETRELRC
jgi:hypothetical protein